MSCKSCKSEAHFSHVSASQIVIEIAHRKLSSPAARSTKIFLACGAPIENCLRLRRAYRKLSSSAVRPLKIFVACGATIEICRRLAAARPSKIVVACGATIENFDFLACGAARSSKMFVACGSPMENFLCLRRARIENFPRLRALIENFPPRFSMQTFLRTMQRNANGPILLFTIHVTIISRFARGEKKTCKSKGKMQN